MSSTTSSDTPWERLKRKVLTTSEVRRVDQRAVEQYKMHSLVLMENAGIGCAQWLIDRFRIPPKCLILCGRGNNGGDGLVIARQLQVAGWSCDALQLGPVAKMSPDASANWQILTAESNQGMWEWSDDKAQSIPLDRLFSQAELIVDAMLGTGAKGNPREPLKSWIERANQSRAYRVAIDVPTGLDADSGKVGEPTFRADSTLTFVALKPAFLMQPALACIGDVTVLPIGIPNTLVESLLT